MTSCREIQNYLQIYGIRVGGAIFINTAVLVIKIAVNVSG